MPDANEIYTKNMKCTCPMGKFCHLYSTDWRRGLGVRGNANLRFGVRGDANLKVLVGISNAKFWRRGHCLGSTPDARYFASQWNIGLKVLILIKRSLKKALYKFIACC